MQGFEWAENNLSVRTPYELESKGVQVFFAPHISAGVKVVDLADGRIDSFEDGERRPTTGYYAEFASMEKYCRDNGSAFHEDGGALRLVPTET